MHNIRITLAVITFLAIGLSTCGPPPPPKPPAPRTIPLTKTIIMKEAPVEQRLNFDFFAQQAIQEKAVTVYYLVAEDGTVVEVGLSDYAVTKVGGTYSSTKWRTKK